MAEKNTLYKRLTLRFSLVNQQQRVILEKLERDGNAGKKTKNQIIMDALSQYYLNQETAISGYLDDYVSKDYLEAQLLATKSEIKAELLRELLKDAVVSATSGNGNDIPKGKESLLGDKKMQKQESYDIDNDDVIMSNVQKWS